MIYVVAIAITITFQSSQQLYKVFLSPFYQWQHQGSDPIDKTNKQPYSPKYLNNWTTAQLQRWALRFRDCKWLTQGHTASEDAPKPEPWGQNKVFTSITVAKLPQPLLSWDADPTQIEYSQLTSLHSTPLQSHPYRWLKAYAAPIAGHKDETLRWERGIKLIDLAGRHTDTRKDWVWYCSQFCQGLPVT